MSGTWCHAYAVHRGVGMLCTLRTGHGGTFHIDVVHNRSWKAKPVVHLHTPTGRTYCGAPAPADRVNGWTAYRSDCTCTDCLGTLADRAVVP